MTDVQARRRFTVTKFGLHEDGYLHARIVIEGTALYVDEKFGSWQAPGKDDKGRYVRKEVLSPYKEDLAARARSFRKVMRSKEIEEQHSERLAMVRKALDVGYDSKQLLDAIVERGLTRQEARALLAEAKDQGVPVVTP